jgi:hypothetical protein
MTGVLALSRSCLPDNEVRVVGLSEDNLNISPSRVVIRKARCSNIFSSPDPSFDSCTLFFSHFRPFSHSLLIPEFRLGCKDNKTNKRTTKDHGLRGAASFSNAQ